VTGPGYMRGYSGLGRYLDLSSKKARSLDRRIGFPRVSIPGIVRPTILFKLSDIDAALAIYRTETPAKPAGVDIGELVEEITERVKGDRR
jgi:hypothetical protein